MGASAELEDEDDDEDEEEDDESLILALRGRNTGRTRLLKVQHSPALRVMAVALAAAGAANHAQGLRSRCSFRLGS